MFEKQYEADKKKKRSSFSLKTFLNHVLETHENEHSEQSIESYYPNTRVYAQSSKEKVHFDKDVKTEIKEHKQIKSPKKNEVKQKNETKPEVTKRKLLTREDAVRSTTPEDVFFYSELK